MRPKMRSMIECIRSHSMIIKNEKNSILIEIYYNSFLVRLRFNIKKNNMYLGRRRSRQTEDQFRSHWNQSRNEKQNK